VKGERQKSLEKIPSAKNYTTFFPKGHLAGDTLLQQIIDFFPRTKSRGNVGDTSHDMWDWIGKESKGVVTGS